jgi:hypothetical protein
MADVKLPEPTELEVGETSVEVDNEEYQTIASVSLSLGKELGDISEEFFINSDDKPVITYVVTEKDGTIIYGEQAEAILAFFHSQIEIKVDAQDAQGAK